MSRAELVTVELRANHVDFVCWLPDSETHFLHDAMTTDDHLEVVKVCSEGEALAMAAGITVGGSCATVLVEDQGLFDSGNALKWIKTLETPMVIMVGYLFYNVNGSHGYLEPFLKAFGIPYYIVDSDDTVSNISRAYEEARRIDGVVAVLVSSADAYHPGSAEGVYGGYPEALAVEDRSTLPVQPSEGWAAPTMERIDALKTVSKVPADAVTITTMSIILDWSEVAPPDGLTFHIAGAMGYASSFGIGLALANPDRKVFVLDGDGSLLMNLGSLVTAASLGVRNLIWLVIENGVYELTGGVTTPGLGRVDLPGLARAAGWTNVYHFADRTKLDDCWPDLLDSEGAVFASIRVKMGPPRRLALGNPPGIQRLRASLAKG
jgi:phosphonopyruvate decarboxylase